MYAYQVQIVFSMPVPTNVYLSRPFIRLQFRFGGKPVKKKKIVPEKGLQSYKGLNQYLPVLNRYRTAPDRV